MTEEAGEPEEAAGPPRGALIAVAVIIGLVVGGFWLSQHMRAANRVQDCVMAGRSNCAPVGAQQ